jgi:hypothetical protein
MPFKALPAKSLTLSVSLLALALGGCAHNRDELTPEQMAVRLKEVPKPTMQGEETFFDGKLLVEASLGRGFRSRRNPRGGGHGNYAEHDYDEFGPSDNDEDKRYVFIPRVNESPLPPVALRLRLTNREKTPLEIEFVECNSQLGNFAVQPKTLTIEPEKSGQPDPMISLLGVTSPELPLTVALKLAGQAEKKILVLKPVAPSPAETAPEKK